MKTIVVFLVVTLCLSSAALRAQVVFESNAAAPVGEYNGATGAAINTNFINSGGSGFAFDPSTNILYFIRGNAVGEYNGTTGATINASLITGLTGNPFGLALSNGNLYVTNQDTGTVGEYNASTGAAIGGFSLSGLNTPRGVLAIGNTLYVVARGSGTIGTYNATTGATISSTFITGLVGPSGLTVSGTNLWVANTDAGSVGEYNVNTGATINGTFISGVGTDFDVKYYGGDLYVAERFSGVGVFDATTAANVRNIPFNTNGPFGILVVPEPGTWAIGILASALLVFQVLRAAAFNRGQTLQKETQQTQD